MDIRADGVLFGAWRFAHQKAEELLEKKTRWWDSSINKITMNTKFFWEVS